MTLRFPQGARAHKLLMIFIRLAADSIIRLLSTLNTYHTTTCDINRLAATS